MRLSKYTIEKLAQMICGKHGNPGHPRAFEWPNFPYRTGDKLYDFFYEDCRLTPISNFSGTRITWTINTLKEVNEGKANHWGIPSDQIIFHVIQKLLESVKQNNHDQCGAIDNVNETLFEEGIRVDLIDGRFAFTRISDASILLESVGYSDIEKREKRENPELFADEIDSFQKTKLITPQQVSSLLPLDLSENKIQTFFEEIIGENFHKQDWGGEMNDLVTSHIKVNEMRLRAVFLLKGNGTKGTLTIAKCGKNGDQIVRLVEAPVDLYVIQHVDRIDERVIYDLKGKVEHKRSKGEKCRMCILDGTDTARILRAYGKI